MFMTAILMSFSRNGKRSRERKTEITGKYNRKALADGWMEQPVSERENLSKWELFYFFHSLSLHHKTTVIYI